MSVLSPDDAAEYLGVTEPTTAQYSQIAGLIDAAEAALTHKCGPLEPISTSERLTGADVLVLTDSPVISVQSVTDDDGNDVDLSHLVLFPEAGMAKFPVGTLSTAAGYTVTYTAGREDVPPALLFAAKEMVRQMWNASNGGSTYGEGSQPAYLGDPMASVASFIAGYVRGPSVA